MNIETVNELIASLESAGELSIKERKYLELAKAYVQLAAENVGLKSFGDTLFDMYKGLEISGGGIHDEQSVVCQQAALDAAMSAFEEIETPSPIASMPGLRQMACLPTSPKSSIAETWKLSAMNLIARTLKISAWHSITSGSCAGADK
jgi:hypothetical protein